MPATRNNTARRASTHGITLRGLAIPAPGIRVLAGLRSSGIAANHLTSLAPAAPPPVEDEKPGEPSPGLPGGPARLGLLGLLRLRRRRCAAPSRGPLETQLIRDEMHAQLKRAHLVNHRIPEGNLDRQAIKQS